MWKLDLVGILLLTFGAVFAICSVSSVLPRASLQVCMLYLAFIWFYFTVTNIITSKKQVYTLLLLFVLSGLCVAAYGIVQYALGLDLDKQVWLDEDMFADLKMRAFSTLDNPNVLGEYLLLVIPVALAFLWSKKGVWVKTAFLAIMGVLLLCLILTMSRGCWIALLFAVAIYITFVDGRYWILGVLGIVALPMVLPASILNRFLSVGDLSDSSTSYRMFIWLGSLRMLGDFWLFGIGPGSAAYNFVYPGYSYTAVVAPHAHNLYLQLALETGVAGFVALMSVFAVFFVRVGSRVRHLGKKNPDRIMLIALASGIAAFLLQGMFDYVFYNYRVVLMFFMTLALTMSLRSTAGQGEAAHD